MAGSLAISWVGCGWVALAPEGGYDRDLCWFFKRAYSRANVCREGMGPAVPSHPTYLIRRACSNRSPWATRFSSQGLKRRCALPIHPPQRAQSAQRLRIAPRPTHTNANRNAPRPRSQLRDAPLRALTADHPPLLFVVVNRDPPTNTLTATHVRCVTRRSAR